MESGPKTLARALAKAHTCGRTSKKRAGLVTQLWAEVPAGREQRTVTELWVSVPVCVGGSTVLTASLNVS